MNPQDLTGGAEHWNNLYGSKSAQELSWTQTRPGVVLSWLEQIGPQPGSAALEVGGGQGILVDHLLERGWGPVTVLDLSEVALEQARTRLGTNGESVRWQVGDVTTAALEPDCYTLWHDRAVFHFLTDPAAVARYVTQASTSLRPGGHLMLSTFAPDGPERCSGLGVQRYSAQTLLELFAPHFRKRATERELHLTPWGAVQPFTCVWLERTSLSVGDVDMTLEQTHKF